MVGTRLAAVSETTVTLELEPREDLLQQYGFVHGGVLAYLADNALTYAGALGLGPSVLTSGMTLDYVAPARAEGVLRAVGTLVSAGRTKATVRCDITQDDRLVATALGTILATRRDA
ncbi:PaaI family thioesterase [Aeromicrobium piscarium]|uniref:Medium/long-chain acyl-CoA thioesterase YigI n=2 Tax=Aeromicrobium piscarium TaxID=2590901 RepID=A0A554S983_9ACTN|nr:PaaI family thioesterase [Aeromicrobium piscarium]